MKVDIRPLLRGEIKELSISYDLVPEPVYGIKFLHNALVDGSLVDNAGYMRLTLHISVDFETSCARCLTPVFDKFDLSFERTVVTKGTLSREQEEENVDEYVIVQNGMLDVDEQLREVLILSLPMRFLCKDDCLGLCPICGKSLNDGACGCKQINNDFRWEVLRNLQQDESDL